MSYESEDFESEDFESDPLASVFAAGFSDVVDPSEPPGPDSPSFPAAFREPRP